MTTGVEISASAHVLSVQNLDELIAMNACDFLIYF
jgi:hypothetical protein